MKKMQQQKTTGSQVNLGKIIKIITKRNENIINARSERESCKREKKLNYKLLFIFRGSY